MVELERAVGQAVGQRCRGRRPVGRARPPQHRHGVARRIGLAVAGKVAVVADFLAMETQAGRLSVDDPVLAAEFFASMVIGAHQLAHLLGVGKYYDEGQIDRVAREATRRFLRAYAPE